MAILFPSDPKIIIQGLTGREATMVAGHMLAYGTAIAAGVTPGKGGGQVHGVPVFDTVASAGRALGKADISIIYVPPLAAYDAVVEAIDAGIALILIITERIPQQDMVKLIHQAEAAGVQLVGPNIVGVINPGLKIKLGPIGGDDPTRCFAPGPVGVISRSGGMTAETSYMVKQAGYGVSTSVSIGGDALIGSSPARLLKMFQDDADTQAVVLFSEPGTAYEEEAARMIESGGFSKPLISFVAGKFVEAMPRGTTFGHTGAMVEADYTRPSAKMRRLARAGVLVAREYSEITALLKRALG
jgi:succinyl-CoA synthetase alpha subunit